ncbi:endospore germination permease [Numidum massiliense]|uniref:endospore germination permease n=1 Tax=Numidum massiliense TaxID=1522315 RepID=UPI0006D59F5E|nr:endospore germination permease [Numidum massiliense]
MTPSSHKISVFLSFMVIVLATGLMNHVTILPPLIGTAKRDAWLSVVLTIVPMLLWIGLLSYIIKNIHPEPLFSWLKAHFGIGVTLAVKMFMFIYLTSIVLLTLKDTTGWTKVFYLPQTPVIVIAASFTAVCLFAAISGMRTIGITAGILLPVVIIFGDFVMSANLPEKNYTLLLPLFEHGWNPVLSGLVYVGGGIAELIIILQLQQYVRRRIRFIPLLLLGLFLLLLIFGTLTGAIAAFGPDEVAKQRYPAYEQWRLVTIGKYIRHVDFLSIYQWLSGALIRIAAAMFLLADCLSLTKRYRTIFLLSFSIAIVFFVQLPIGDASMLNFLNRFYFPLSLASVAVLTLALFLLVLMAKRRKKGSCA